MVLESLGDVTLTSWSLGSSSGSNSASLGLRWPASPPAGCLLLPGSLSERLSLDDEAVGCKEAVDTPDAIEGSEDGLTAGSWTSLLGEDGEIKAAVTVTSLVDINTTRHKHTHTQKMKPSTNQQEGRS